MENSGRKPNRIPNFDYGQEGSYFVTLCTHNRAPIFQMETLSESAPYLPSCSLQNQLICKWIKETQNKYQNISIDKYVIMQDHLHLLITINQSQSGASLEEIMRFFKTMTTNEYIRGVKSGLFPPFDKKLWQKSYYDHVIRNFQDYLETWEYIENNPAKWKYTHESGWNGT